MPEIEGILVIVGLILILLCTLSFADLVDTLPFYVFDDFYQQGQGTVKLDEHTSNLGSTWSRFSDVDQFDLVLNSGFATADKNKSHLANQIGLVGYTPPRYVTLTTTCLQYAAVFTVPITEVPGRISFQYTFHNASGNGVVVDFTNSVTDDEKVLSLYNMTGYVVDYGNVLVSASQAGVVPDGTELSLIALVLWDGTVIARILELAIEADAQLPLYTIQDQFTMFSIGLRNNGLGSKHFELNTVGVTPAPVTVGSSTGGSDLCPGGCLNWPGTCCQRPCHAGRYGTFCIPACYPCPSQ